MTRMVGLVMAVCAIGSAAGCGSSSRTVAHFDGYGDIDRQPLATPRVATPEQVKVYYRAAPEGFSLHDSVLEVEAGFDHQILGSIVVRWNDEGPPCSEPPPFTKYDVFAQMRATAHQLGGTAVIYARSAVPDNPDEDELCTWIEWNSPALGNAWVVVLGGPNEAAPAATPPLPQAPAAAPPPAAP